MYVCQCMQSQVVEDDKHVSIRAKVGRPYRTLACQSMCVRARALRSSHHECTHACSRVTHPSLSLSQVTVLGGSIIHKETFPKDGSVGRGIMRRDVKPGYATFRGYLAHTGELVLV